MCAMTIKTNALFTERENETMRETKGFPEKHSILIKNHLLKS